MILYHATTSKNLQGILDQGLLINMPSNFPEEVETTKGYLYLSDNLAVPTYYANMIAIRNRTESIVIFEIDIDKSQLLPDFDQPKFISGIDFKEGEFSVQDSLDLYASVRLSGNIELKNIKRYSVIPSKKGSLHDTEEIKAARELTDLLIHAGKQCKTKELSDGARAISQEIISQLSWNCL